MGSIGNIVSSSDMKDALQYYTEDGYYINSILRGGDELDDREKEYVKILDAATQKDVKHDELYRVVDMSVVFGKLNDIDSDNLRAHLLFGDDYYDKGAYMQGIKKQMTAIVDNLNKGGRNLEDKGYMSTTYDYEKAVEKQVDPTHSSYNGIILRITNAKDLKGAEIGGSEKEVLLRRKYKYNFKKAYRNKKDNVIIVDTVLS